MRHRTALLPFIAIMALQACSQSKFTQQSYNFPIPVEAPPTVTMRDKAERQAKEREQLLGDPYKGGTKLVVDLKQLTDEEWRYPLPGAKVLSPYGNSRPGHRHSGVDLKTKPKDKILAAFDGIVTMSQPFAGYGNCVIIRHTNGLETLYSHNVKNLVKVGEHVKAGQVIALTGRTGRATTEHLHFEVRVAGKHYNPNLVFDHDTKQLRRNKLTFFKKGGVKTH